MYSTLQLIARYIQFIGTASNAKGHGMHSPFVYQFIKEVLNDTQKYPAYTQWEQWRKSLMSNQELVDLFEMGAGSRAGAKKQRSVSSLVKLASKPPRVAKLLFRIVHYYKPTCILELGTSLGLSTAIFSQANPKAIIHTVEGMPSLASRAKMQFSQWGLTNCEVHQGSFEDLLQPLLSRIPTPELVYVDGNHRKEPTIRYFHSLLEKLSFDGIIIFDDIHWSAEMEEAWELIKQDCRVRCTIDLFHFGIVLLREDFIEPRHFKVRF
jgi:predicted O-methyltransferase YrrM